MHTEEAVEVKVELKYCEACGGLWLRSEDADEVYCRTCRGRMAEIALRRGGLQ